MTKDQMLMVIIKVSSVAYILKTDHVEDLMQSTLKSNSSKGVHW